MSKAIVKNFEETVYKALEKYSDKYKVELRETGLCLWLDEDKEVNYSVLLAQKSRDAVITGYNKAEDVDFVSGILFKKMDLTGKSIIVPAFIKQVLLSFAEEYGCEYTNLFVNIFPTGGNTVMYLYVNKKFKEQLDLKNLLE
jgi:hypothetical protein